MSQANLALKGSVVLVVTKLSEKLLGLVSTLILARLLIPEDFGIIAISHLVLYFMLMVANSGGREYIMQKTDVDEDDINTFWSLDICLKVFVFFLTLAITPLIVNYYEDDRLYLLIAILATMLPINALVNPDIIARQREQNYIPLLKLDIVRKAISVILAIAAAFYFQNYWALIVGHVSSNVIGLVYSYFLLKYRPKFTLVKLKEQWGFSQWVLYRSMLGYSRAQLDTFFVSSFYSASSLGGFHISKYISSMPATEVVAPALQPLLASFSKNKNIISNFQHQVFLTIMVVSATAIPLTAFVFTNSPNIVLIALGEQWVQYSSLFAILSLLVIPQAISSIAASILTAIGKVNFLFYYDIVSLSITIFVLYSLKDNPLELFTIGKISIELVMVSVLFFIGAKKLFSSSTYFMFTLLVTSAACAFGVTYLLNLFTIGLPPFFEVAVKFMMFAVCWLITCSVYFKLFLNKNHAALHIKYLLEQGFIKAKLLLRSKSSE